MHLVWENYNDNQIWHRRSLDQGATWDIPRRVSNAPPGEFAMCPYVVANGSNVYVFWVDSRDSLKVYMGKSMDNGETWTAADKRISSFHESIVIGTPKAAIWGDTIYVFWTDDYFWYEGKAPEVFFSKSLDCGESWTTPSHVTDNDDSMSGVAEVCVYENTVHLAFVEERDPKLETYYKRSDDGGNTWTEDILVSTRDTYNSIAGSGMSMACDGTTLHMVMQEWRDAPGLEIYYSRSTDNGDTWAEPTRLSKNDDYNNTIGAIAADNGRVFAVWDDAEYNNICYRISGDGGETWTEI
ncbi:MAG: sialidase family protein, partial [Candidatus Thermoplasmatota archaeon]|nr:sialidase family protein [Candidatus Thermoplasmatota archaeon]